MNGSTRPLALAGLVILASLALVYGTVTLHHRQRQGEFQRVCEGARVGRPVAELERDFVAIHERTSGSGRGGGSVSEHWFRRTGQTRFQQCTVEVDPTTRRIVSVGHRAGTDFTSRTDRGTYPRRYLFCIVGDAIAL